MTRYRSLILAVMPRSWREAVETESREWMATCRSCGLERSVWDHGGLRWKARGQAGMRLVCTGCRGPRNHRIARDLHA